MHTRARTWLINRTIIVFFFVSFHSSIDLLLQFTINSNRSSFRAMELRRCDGRQGTTSTKEMERNLSKLHQLFGHKVWRTFGRVARPLKSKKPQCWRQRGASRWLFEDTTTKFSAVLCCRFFYGSSVCSSSMFNRTEKKTNRRTFIRTTILICHLWFCNFVTVAKRPKKMILWTSKFLVNASPLCQSLPFFTCARSAPHRKL